MFEMPALLYHGRRDVRLTMLPRPVPGPQEVLVQVTDAGLSQTQINEFMEGPLIINVNPHPRTGLAAPIIPCQEYGGRAVAVGDGVDPSLIGKLVAVLPLQGCGTCARCAAGQPNICAQLVYRGLVGAHGGFCGFSAVPADAAFEVDRPDLLTFIEPLLVGMHSLRRMRGPLDGARVLVIGAGAVGCAVAAVWQHCGHAQVDIYDRLPARSERCKAIGLRAIPEPTVMGSYDVVIDAAGKDTLAERQALETAYDFCRPGGVVVSIGVYFSPVQWLPIMHTATEKDTLQSFAYNLEDVIELRRALVDFPFRFDALIQRLRFDELVENGYYEAELDKSRFTRIVASVDG